jgi:hypothetical protein
VDANKAPGLRSTVVLDQLFNAGSAFEAGGTPTARSSSMRGQGSTEVAADAAGCACAACSQAVSCDAKYL